MRHPLYVGWLLTFWATPTMTAAHLVFALATTAYILIAIWFEERDLIAQFGDSTGATAEVPMLIPLPRRKKQAVNPRDKRRGGKTRKPGNLAEKKTNSQEERQRTCKWRAHRRRKSETGTVLLEAAKKILRQNGYAGLSTRDVAAAAGVPLSQIHYHFGSKQDMVLALFEYLNAQLLDRQNALFGDTTLKLSEQWNRACDYLDEDIASGYVRVMQELTAASWSDPAVAKVVRAGMVGWLDLITNLARKAGRQFGGFGPLTAEEVGALVGSAFIGAESHYLLGFEKQGLPVRQALRRFGELIRIAEGRSATIR